MEIKQLQTLIDVYIKSNIPFAIFKYPNEKISLIAQYNENYVVEDIDFKQEGFLIHPFINDGKTPMVLIKPNVFTTSFNTINLTEVPILKKPNQYTFNERVINYASYKNTLQKQLNLLKNNTLKKIVFSRIELLAEIELNTLAGKFDQLCTQNPNTLCYLFNLPGIGLWLGATPEVLLHYKNNIAKTVALAGTKKITDHKVWGNKEIEEQGLVGEYIEKICRNLNLKINTKSETETITAGNIQHLKTNYQIEVGKNKLAALIKALHPTPAVAGLPKQKAIQHILEIENYDRQYYTGFLGMVQPNKTQLYVNLRCAKITPTNALAFVGGGITKDSNIENEWEETVAKSGVIERLLKS